MDWNKAQKQVSGAPRKNQKSWNIKNEMPREDLRNDIAMKQYKKGKPTAKQPKYNF